MPCGVTALRLWALLCMCFTLVYPAEYAVGNTPIIIDAEHGQVKDRITILQCFFNLNF